MAPRDRGSDESRNAALLEAANSLRLGGAGIDPVVAYVWRETSSFVRCAIVVAKVFELGLGDAKAAVHDSPAMAGDHAAREAFWAELCQAAEDLADADTAGKHSNRGDHVTHD